MPNLEEFRIHPEYEIYYLPSFLGPAEQSSIQSKVRISSVVYVFPPTDLHHGKAGRDRTDEGHRWRHKIRSGSV